MSAELKFTTQPYLPAEGREFLEYMQVVMKSMDRLREGGRIPDDKGMDTLLAFWTKVIAQVGQDVDRAGAASALPIRTSLPMSAVEHQRTWALFDTLYPLLEILEMRDVIDLKRTDSVTHVIDALYEGTLA